MRSSDLFALICKKMPKVPKIMESLRSIYNQILISKLIRFSSFLFSEYSIISVINFEGGIKNGVEPGTE